MTVLSEDLYSRIRRTVTPGQVISTLGLGKPNRIVEIGPDGILVETERSVRLGTGPRLVPAELLESDWETLVSTGTLTSANASHRGSFTGALFALFDDVEVVSSRPRVLIHTPNGHAPGRGSQ